MRSGHQGCGFARCGRAEAARQAKLGQRRLAQLQGARGVGAVELCHQIAQPAVVQFDPAAAPIVRDGGVELHATLDPPGGNPHALAGDDHDRTIPCGGGCDPDLAFMHGDFGRVGQAVDVERRAQRGHRRVPRMHGEGP